MLSAPLPREQIETLIPHAGGMCLNDEVLDWDAAGIHCRSRGHRIAGHVLARDGRLASLHLIEFGAQAMAIHGGLLAAQEGRQARAGFLASVRRVQLSREWLEEIAGPLDIFATRVAGGDAGWTYDFQALAGDEQLAEGRVSVMFMMENSR